MDNNFAILHAHTYYSLQDSPLSPAALAEGAKTARASAVAITDHGSCMGWFEFMKACEKTGIKGIPGVEAYVKTPYAPRAHLILLAKNYEGFREISRFISDGHKTQEKLFKNVYVPVSDVSTLEDYFGNGNVIATTACIAGPAGSVWLGQAKLKDSIDKLKKNMAQCISPDSPEYLAAKEKADSLEFDVQRSIERRDELKRLAERKFTAKKKGLDAIPHDTPAYKAAKTRLENEIRESAEAAKELEKEKKHLASKKTAKTAHNRMLRTMTESTKRYSRLELQIKKQEKELLDENSAISAAREMLAMLGDIFGSDLYAEVQYHGIEEEKEIYPRVAAMAKAMGIPLIAANDVHIGSPEQAEIRQMLTSMRFDTWQAGRPGDGELYIKTESQLRKALGQILTPEQVDEAILNTAIVAGQCNVVIPKGQHYPKFVGNMEGCMDTRELLAEHAMAGAHRLFGENLPEEYENRLKYELSIIHKLGYDDYMLIVEDNAKFARDYGSTLDETGLSYSVGPGRGSAVGSLTAYLLGITRIDPMQYGLIFERFLNPNRVSNPDIDMDFSYEARNAAMEHVREMYGNDCVGVIRTAIKQSAKLAVHNSARVLGYELYPFGDGKDKKDAEQGRRRVAALGDEIANEVPQIPDATLKTVFGCPPRDFALEEENTILRRAMASEGVVVSTGVHPAGLLITDGVPLLKYVPLFYSREEDKWGAQCDMSEAEEAGLLKMDFLGLNTLDIITECIRRIKKDTGTAIDPDNLPFEDEVFEKIFASGDTGCVFQFESQGMRSMLRQFKPSCFEDIILLVAAYRPGPMDLIPDIMAVKNGKAKPSYPVPGLKDILNVTYGKPIYQEQLMQIFEKCAGFTLGEADVIRRAMAKKKSSAFIEHKGRFIEGACMKGASGEAAKELWDSLTDFAKYAFNKSHAAAYAMLAYQTAWLKYHYPKEFMTAALNHPRMSDRIPVLIAECRLLRIPVYGPDINRSQKTFEVEEDGIRFGLSAIRYVDSQADSIIMERRNGGGFYDFRDFMLRWPGNKRVVRSLIDSGCFDAAYASKVPESGGRPLTVRSQIAEFYEECLPFVSDIRTKQDRITALGAEAAVSSAKERGAIEDKIRRAGNAIASDKAELTASDIDCLMPDRSKDALAKEKEALGTYISAHPLDEYLQRYGKDGISFISDINQKYAKILGVVTKIRKTSRKSDGAPMAFFTAEDPSGSIEAVCFADIYENVGTVLENDAILLFHGEIRKQDKGGDVVRQLIVKNAYPVAPREQYTVVTAPDKECFERHITEFEKAQCPDGRRLLLLDLSDPSGHLTDTGILVSIPGPVRLTND